jgi:hypothetical protein
MPMVKRGEYASKINEEKEYKYKPSDKEQGVVNDVFRKFCASREERDKPYQYFDGKTLLEYTSDNVKRFTTNEFWRDDIDDWQANLHQPFTRNKILSVLSRVVDSLPSIEYKNRQLDDIRKANILNALVEYVDDVDDNEELMVFAILEALVKGTVIGFEGYSEQKVSVRDIEKLSGDKIIIKERDRIVRKIFGSLIPIESFYPSSVGIRKIDDMPYCFVRRVRPYSEFISKNKEYAKSEYVERKSGTNETDSQLFYKDYISDDVAEGYVEEIEYWNKLTDEYVKLANGVWLNPVEIEGEENVSPIPYNHKTLPFWSFIYDAFGEDFFYGKSLSDRLSVLNDTLDVLDNMLLDQSFLTIFSPMLFSGIDPIEDDILKPGRRIAIDTAGLPLNQSVMSLQQQTPSGWHQFILDYTKRVLEETSIDSVSQGIAGVGERTTATEIRAAASGVVTLLGLFAKFIKFGIKRKYLLRGKNVLQFSTQANSPLIEQVMGIGGSKLFDKAFQTFVIDGQVLPSGKRGTSIIAMYSSEKDMPTDEQSKAIKSILESENNPKKFSITNITPEYIRNMEFDIKLVMNTKSESGKELDKALTISKIQTYMTFFPDIMNRQEIAAELAEAFGDDPTRIFRDNIMNPQETPTGATRESGGQAATAQNMVQGETGVTQGQTQLRDLMQQMQ